MSKIKLICLFQILIVFFITGCWNRAELNDRAIVMGVGVDKYDKNSYEVTVQILLPEKVGIPSAAGGASDVDKAVWIVSERGNTVFEAVRKLANITGRKLFWQYSEMLIIGEEAAKEGVIPIIDHFIRDHEFRLRNKFIIARGTAKEIIDTNHPLEVIPAEAIKSIVESGRVTGTVVDVNLLDFSMMLEEMVSAPVTPSIIKLPDAPMDKQVDITGAAVFDKDRLRAYLNQTETRGYNIIKGNIVSGILVLHPLEDDPRGISVEIIRMRSSVYPITVDDEVQINIDVKVDGNIAEQQYMGNIDQQEVWERLERLTAQIVQKEMNTVLTKSQTDLKLDFLGFADILYRNHPKIWKSLEQEWDRQYPALQINTHVDVRLMRTGITRVPPRSK